MYDASKHTAVENFTKDYSHSDKIIFSSNTDTRCGSLACSVDQLKEKPQEQPEFDRLIYTGTLERKIRTVTDERDELCHVIKASYKLHPKYSSGMKSIFLSFETKSN